MSSLNPFSSLADEELATARLLLNNRPLTEGHIVCCIYPLEQAQMVLDTAENFVHQVQTYLNELNKKYPRIFRFQGQSD